MNRIYISPVVFLLVTYIIIEYRIYTCLNGIKYMQNNVALFFVNDGMILMRTLQEAKESIQILSNIAKTYCVLSINKNFHQI